MDESRVTLITLVAREFLYAVQENYFKQKKLYKQFWNMLSHRGAWDDDRYIVRKSFAVPRNSRQKRYVWQSHVPGIRRCHSNGNMHKKNGYMYKKNYAVTITVIKNDLPKFSMVKFPFIQNKLSGFNMIYSLYLIINISINLHKKNDYTKFINRLKSTGSACI